MQSRAPRFSGATVGILPLRWRFSGATRWGTYCRCGGDGDGLGLRNVEDLADEGEVVDQARLLPVGAQVGALEVRLREVLIDLGRVHGLAKGGEDVPQLLRGDGSCRRGTAQALRVNGALRTMQGGVGLLTSILFVECFESFLQTSTASVWRNQVAKAHHQGLASSCSTDSFVCSLLPITCKKSGYLTIPSPFGSRY